MDGTKAYLSPFSLLYILFWKCQWMEFSNKAIKWLVHRRFALGTYFYLLENECETDEDKNCVNTDIVSSLGWLPLVSCTKCQRDPSQNVKLIFFSGLNNGVHLCLQPGRGSLALGNQWGNQPRGEQRKVRNFRCTRWGWWQLVHRVGLIIPLLLGGIIGILAEETTWWSTQSKVNLALWRLWNTVSPYIFHWKDFLY